MSEHPKPCTLVLQGCSFHELLSSTNVRSTATMKCWMKKTSNATFGFDKGELVQVALLQIHDGDGAYLCLGSLIGVSSVHSCLILFKQDTSFFTSFIVLRRCAVGVVFLCKFVHRNAHFFNLTNFDLRITIC